MIGFALEVPRRGAGFGLPTVLRAAWGDRIVHHADSGDGQRPGSAETGRRRLHLGGCPVEQKHPGFRVTLHVKHMWLTISKFKVLPLSGSCRLR